jgi:hypothetical protein
MFTYLWATSLSHLALQQEKYSRFDLASVNLRTASMTALPSKCTTYYRTGTARGAPGLQADTLIDAHRDLAKVKGSQSACVRGAESLQ